MSKKNVEIILDHGISKIGNLDLNKLVEDLDQVDWRTFSLGFMIGSGEKDRTGSVYYVKTKMVVVNMLYLNNLVNKPVHLYPWLLHEAMGALGYSDENYELSSSISFIASLIESDNQIILKSILSNINQDFINLSRTKTNLLYAMSGGSTIVGGGGDAIIIELKQRLLERFLHWSKYHGNDLPADRINYGMKLIIHLGIEFESHSESYGSFDFRIKNEQLLLDLGGSILPATIFTDSYLDSLLNTIFKIKNN
jgi:hypothetical protein